jgi:methylenetetrahydrofolate--tRNA-(uracil-5-)-methyltransferase
MLGALCHYITHAEAKNFQPMKANFGLFDQPQQKIGKNERYQWYSARSLTSLRRFARANALNYDREVAESDLSVEMKESSLQDFT